jgi:ABC-type sugar transport system permease subunit/ABC-type glycerol-3-phosphate transport system substrate-binding protein
VGEDRHGVIFTAARGLGMIGRLLAILCCVACFLLAGRPAGAETVIKFYAQAYTPEIVTGDNPIPLHEFTRLAREWEKLHPGVRIEFLKNPVGEYRTWMRTQLQGHVAPDIMWAHAVWTNEDTKYGWFADFDPYLAQPNPYVKAGERGSVRWGDTFYESQTNARRAPDGHLYTLPIDLVETAIYYNQDLFDRVGGKPPNTWAEFIDLQRRLKAAGIIPFLMTGGEPMVFSWTKGVLGDQLWQDRLAEMDIRTRPPGGYPGIDPQEFVRAYKKGIFSVRDPRYREMLRLMKEWSQYWQPDFLSAKDEEDRLFRLGKAAMFWNGSWYAPKIKRDPLRTFRYGIFLLPPLTKESTPFASLAHARSPGGAASLQYAITTTAISGGKVDLCIDFLRYVTAPQNLGPLVSEAEMFVPNAVGVPGAPLQAPFLPLLARGQVMNEGETAGPKYDDQSFRVLQDFLGGRIDLDQAVDRLDQYLKQGVEDTLREHADQWRWGPDWRILPAAATEPDPPSHAPWGTLAGVAACALILVVYALSRPAVWRCRNSYLYILPTFVALILFSYYPMLQAFSHALTEWRGNGDSTWTGLANFRELFRDDVMGDSAKNALILLLAQVVITLTVPLAVAEAIFGLRSLRSQYVYRVLFVVPMVVPGIVMLLVWGFFFDYNLGPLNNALAAVGLAHWKQAWLGDPRISLFSLIGIGFPWVGGFALLVYYAGLQNIPTDVFDSACIDGAKGLTRFRFVDLPLLLGQTRLLLVLAFIDGVQGFQTQLLLTNGGPGYSTMVPGLHIYESAMTFDRMGYACAIGVLLFAVCLGLTYVNLNTFRASSEYQP